MLSSSVRTFKDPDEYAAALQQGRVELTITQRGIFTAKLCTVNLHGLWMQSLSEDLARTSHCRRVGRTRLHCVPDITRAKRDTKRR
jgi:hypothetical protein